MRLLCIAESADWIDGLSQPMPGPAYMEEVTAIGETTAYHFRAGEYETYLLKEYHDREGFAKRAFIPLTGEKEEVEEDVELEHLVEKYSK